MFSGHITDITQWFCPIKHPYFHAKNHIQQLTGQLIAIWMWDNCNNVPKGLSGKGLYCWIVHLFHEEIFTRKPFLSLPPLVNRTVETGVPVRIGWIVCLEKKFIRKICKPGLTVLCCSYTTILNMRYHRSGSIQQACFCIKNKIEKSLSNQWKMWFEYKRWEKPYLLQ